MFADVNGQLSLQACMAPASALILLFPGISQTSCREQNLADWPQGPGMVIASILQDHGARTLDT